MMKKERKRDDAAPASKAFKSGSYSLALCAIVLVIAVLVNLIVGKLPSKFTEPDISSGDLFTLSDYSKQIVEGVSIEVKIYQLATDSGKDPYVSRLLDRYAELNKNIKVELRDPEISQIATQYTKDEVKENSLIFVSEKRSKVVDYSSLYSYSEDAMNAYYSGGSTTNPDEFCGEKEITSALSFVTTDVLPKIFALTGHDEFEITDTLTSLIASENIELNTLDLMTAKEIPEDCACLLLLAPSVDLTEKELTTILDYMDKGGRVLISTLTKSNMKTDAPNFEKLLKNIGVLAGDGFIIEGSSESYYYSPTYLLPETDSHEITDPLTEKNYRICMPVCRNLKADPNVRSTVVVTPLLTTSDDAFARVDVNIETAEKADSDLDGPFDVALAVTSGEGAEEMRAVVTASPYFMDDQFLSLSGNVNFLLNSLKWMCDLEENISVVDVKSLSSGGSLEMDSAVGSMLMVVYMLVIPFSILCTGIVIHVRRKKR